MLTKAAVARDWGVSQTYVNTCVKKGCPLTSFEDARDWRLAHASQRETTSAIQLAKKVAEEADDDSPEARKRRKAYFEDKAGEPRIPSASSLDEALFASIRASDEAFRMLQEAMIEGKDSKIGVRLSIHTKAVEARFEAEKSYREEQERRRILIPLAEAQDMARKGFDIIIARLAALPQNMAQRCNPSDPHRAMEALKTEVAAIVAKAQKAFE